MRASTVFTLLTSFHVMHIKLPGPSNSHSSPAILFSPDSDSKSSIARNLMAELAITTFRAVTSCFKTSPGYKGNGSCARRISYNMIQPLSSWSGVKADSSVKAVC